MATPEGRVKDAVHKFLREIGCIRAGTSEHNWPEKPEGWYYMPVKAAAFGVNGIPDFVGHYRGRFFSIETKAPGKVENLSANQVNRIRELSVSGGVAVVVDDVSQVRDLLT